MFRRHTLLARLPEYNWEALGQQLCVLHQLRRVHFSLKTDRRWQDEEQPPIGSAGKEFTIGRLVHVIAEATRDLVSWPPVSVSADWNGEELYLNQGENIFCVQNPVLNILLSRLAHPEVLQRYS